MNTPMNTLPGESRLSAAETIFLHANDEAYRRLIERIQGMNRHEAPDSILREVARAALLASEFHAGRFADGAIENMALEAGAALDLPVEVSQTPASTRTQAKRRRILHVATQVSPIGGHSRLIAHWARHDQTSLHSLAIVDQGNETVPSWLSDAMRVSGGEVIRIPTTTLSDKALRLRRLAKNQADLVVLHLHPFDVVPTVAFARTDCPPIAVFNHADHQFCLGSSVSDIAICFRTVASEHAVQRRSIAATIVLPVPLTDRPGRRTKVDARSSLGIPEDQVMLLTIGRAEKYRPSATYDFVKTVGKILEKYLNAHVYLIGETLGGITPYLRSAVHERLHFMGPVEDPSLWRSAADVYLESFPFGSHTALLEAALSGLPVVPAYAPLFPLIVAHDDSLNDLIPNPQSEEEYIERCGRLIQGSELRIELAEALQDRLRIDHVGAGWLRRLAAVYEKTDYLSHNPQPIPVSQCCITDGDCALSLWHARADGENWTSDIFRNSTGAMLRHSAFVARTAADYIGAVRFGVRAVRHDPWSRASWRVLTLTVLGKTAGRVVMRTRQYWKKFSRKGRSEPA
jgi:glycosyltransferase involved in cell wall biosynthesis